MPDIGTFHGIVYIHNTFFYVMGFSRDCRAEPVMPMIPLGLKETKEIDFRESFKDFILEHYSEDASLYEDAITDLMDLRQVIISFDYFVLEFLN